MALPAAPALPLTGNPYALFELEVVYVVPTIANISAPTLAELNAGQDITKHINAIAGFDLQAASIQFTRAGTTFEGSVPGRQSAGQSTMTFINSDAGPTSDIRGVTSLALSATGNIVFFNEGVVTGGAMDVWPYRVASVSPGHDLEQVGQTVITFDIPIKPALFVSIPVA